MKEKFFLFILVFLLGLVGFLVNFEWKDSSQAKVAKLPSAISHLPEWNIVSTIPIEEKIIEALQLDDFLFQSYSNGTESITLYIGYYHTAKKVGAAHDPMVCFPGQGWKVTKTTKGVAKVPGTGGEPLSYATITADLGDKSEHILYWFQAYDEPAASTLQQKILLFKKTLQGKGQDNAFVRVSMPCAPNNTAQCEQTLLHFVSDFYPVFLSFISAP